MQVRQPVNDKLGKLAGAAICAAVDFILWHVAANKKPANAVFALRCGIAIALISIAGVMWLLQDSVKFIWRGSLRKRKPQSVPTAPGSRPGHTD